MIVDAVHGGVRLLADETRRFTMLGRQDGRPAAAFRFGKCEKITAARSNRTC